MGFLSNANLKIYEGKWNKVGNVDTFDADDLNLLKPMAEVVKSTYGCSVRFELKAGGKIFIPLSTDEDLEIGTQIDITMVEIIHLQKEGTSDIIDRVTIKKPSMVLNNNAADSFEL